MRVDKVTFVSQDADGAVSLIDTMLANEKVSSSSELLEENLAKYGKELSLETNSLLQRIVKESETCVFNRLITNGENITELAGMDKVKVGFFEVTSGGTVIQELQDGTKVYVYTDNAIHSKLADDMSMLKQWGEGYYSLSVAEKYQAKQIEYWMRQLPDGSNNISLRITDNMSYSDNVIRAGVEAILQNKSYDYINGVSRKDLQLISASGDAGRQSVLDILKSTTNDTTGSSSTAGNWFIKADYATPESNKYTIFNCYDETGKFVGVELVDIGNNTHVISQGTEAVLRVDISEFSDFTQYADDAKIAEMFGYDNFVNFTDLEKLQAKEIEFQLRPYTNLQGVPADDLIRNSYLVTTGKKIDQLDDIDLLMLKVGEEIASDSQDIPKVLNTVSRYDNVLKVADNVGGLVDVLGTTYVVGKCIYDANSAYRNGDIYTAAGLVTGVATELVVSGLGGAALTAAISPYLTGLGAAIGAGVGGPIGAPIGTAIGSLLSGVIGYGLAGLAGSELNEYIVKLFSELDNDYTRAGAAVAYYVADPLVFDMDGDGFELKSVEEGVYFDENNEGLKEKTQWVAADDALLAMDLDKDGTIDDGSELFGTSTELADGSTAKSGFEALAQYDTNADGKISADDDAFSDLLLWQDKNSDGISQQDELFTLQKLGIETISLNYTEENGTNAAEVSFAGGTGSKMGEFIFDAQLYNTVEKEPIEISEEIKGMPNVQAIGNVASLHTLMQLDETGTLKEYVSQFGQVAVMEEREQIVTRILYFITGADKVASASRGGLFDAKKLTVIEQFLGKDFVGTAGRNPVNTAVNVLDGMYKDIFEAYYNVLSAETYLKDYLNLTLWTTNEKGAKYLNTMFFDAYVSASISEGIDMTNAVAEMGRYIAYMNAANIDNFDNFVTTYADREEYIKALAEISNRIMVGTEGDDSMGINNASFLFGCEGHDTLSGGNGNDRLYGGTGNDTINADGGHDVLYGGEGNDTLNAGYENDMLYGESGNDALRGSYGKDVLYGGTGNDYLNGGYGADTYIFNKGDGADTICDYDSTSGNADKLVIGEEARNLMFAKSGSNLLISIIDSADSVTIQNWYQNDYCKVETIQVDDGYILSHKQVDLLIQSMASFESTSGMSWSEGVLTGNEDVSNRISQIWIKEEIA